MENPENRRREPRFDVHIRVDAYTRELFVSNYMTNISRGGLFIQTSSPLPLWSGIELKFTLPDINKVFEVKGKVVWTYDIKKGTGRIRPGMGIKFTDILPEQKKILEDYLERLPGKNDMVT